MNPDLPFLPQVLPLLSTPSKKQKKGKSKKLKKKKSKKKSVVFGQSLIGDRVAAVLGNSITHFRTILSSRILDNGKKNWEILYYNNFDEEEVDAIELSTHQDLYNLKVENDIVWQKSRM